MVLPGQESNLGCWDRTPASYHLTTMTHMVGWGTDSSNTEVLVFTKILYTVIVSYSTLDYPCLNFGNGIFWCNYFVFLIIKSAFLFMWSARPSILNEVSITLDDYFLRQILGSKICPDLPWPQKLLRKVWEWGRDGLGSNNFGLAWVKFLLLGLGWVSQFWFWKFPLKIPNFPIFLPFGSEKILSCRIKKYLLFTAGQKYARVRAHLWNEGISVNITMKWVQQECDGI